MEYMNTDLLGSQRTFLSSDVKDRELCINVRQKLATRRGLNAKFWGCLNTVSSDMSYKACIKKQFGGYTALCSGWMQIAKEWDEERQGNYGRKVRLDRELVQRVNTLFPSGIRHALFSDWFSELGVQWSNLEQDTTQYTVSLGKKPQYIKHFFRTDCFADCTLKAAFSPSSRETVWRMNPRLHILRSDVTLEQDVTVSIGCDLRASDTHFTKDLYLSVGDSRWQATFKQGTWKLAFDL